MRKIIPLHHFKPCSIRKRFGGWGVIYVFYIQFNNIIISSIHLSSTVLDLNGVSGGAGAYHSCLQARGGGYHPGRVTSSSKGWHIERDEHTHSYTTQKGTVLTPAAPHHFFQLIFGIWMDTAALNRRGSISALPCKALGLIISKVYMKWSIGNCLFWDIYCNCISFSQFHSVWSFFRSPAL